MIEVQKTDEFDSWLSALADQRAIAKITSRIERLGMGNAGDVKAVGEGVSEMRLTYGPGYRVYYKQTGKKIILILCGGDKSTKDPAYICAALDTVARAKGIGDVAKATGLSRESLYKTFKETAKPEFDTVRKVMGSFGVKLVAEPIDEQKVV